MKPDGLTKCFLKINTLTFSLLVITFCEHCRNFFATSSIVSSGVRRNFSWGDFIQWHRVVICIWCALFVTSQFDVIVLFPNKRFSEVR